LGRGFSLRQGRRRLRLAVALAVALAAAAAGLAIRQFSSSRPTPVYAPLSAEIGSYLGVYEAGALRSYRPVGEFAQAVGQAPNLAGYYSGWPESFATSFAERARSHGAATIVQLDPTGIPVARIADGGYDGYLRSFADSVRDFGHPVVIGFGHEMNATWYSWGYGHVPAATFIAAWRHIVTLFRGQGADNVTWLWTINTDSPGTGPIRAWWPGAAYVTWIGIDGYFYRRSDTFASVFGRTIGQVRSFTGKPVLLSETAVGPAAGQPAKIGELFRGMRQDRTLGLVWFDIAQHHGIYHQDWRIEDSRAALAAFRAEVRQELAPASRSASPGR
jgi:mannan endo-1,4-beta-mannosidase